MTADTLLRLQALPGLTRVGSTHTVLAQLQGDLQTVIEAVLELAGENTPPASQNGPQDARSADSGTDAPPEPQNGAQGRIGWLRMGPGNKRRLLTQEVPGGWTDADEDGDPLWLAEDWPDAEFTPIRTLADDEVAVKRDHEAAAEQRGRVAALREAQHAWQTGEWTALTEAAKHPEQVQRILGTAQAVTAWLCDRADALEAGEDV